MPKKRIKPATHKKPAVDAGTTALKGWKAIADFLGQPVNVAQRWGRTGMPVRREGRYTVAAAADLSRWLGRESGAGEPVHIASETDIDLASELKKSLAAAKEKRAPKRK